MKGKERRGEEGREKGREKRIKGRGDEEKKINLCPYLTLYMKINLKRPLI